MYEIKKIRKKKQKKTKKFSGQPYVSEFEKNIELSIGEVNGHFYLKIKVKKVRKKIEPSCYDPKIEILIEHFGGIFWKKSLVKNFLVQKIGEEECVQIFVIFFTQACSKNTDCNLRLCEVVVNNYYFIAFDNLMNRFGNDF